MKRAEAALIRRVSVVPVGCDYMGYPFEALGIDSQSDRMVGLRTWLYEKVVTITGRKVGSA